MLDDVFYVQLWSGNLALLNSVIEGYVASRENNTTIPNWSGTLVRTWTIIRRFCRVCLPRSFPGRTSIRRI